jgi:catechol 2,3-dioxygenase-like lactoylglutathione lyase family enzyme
VLDHVTLRVHDLAASKAFYAAVLAPLGYAVIAEYPETVGLGVGGKPDLWLTPDPSSSPQHLAFAASSRMAVDDFHAAGLAAGGRDNGAPGLRVHYHPNYYGAFVDDPSGHHLEAVIHTPTGGAKKGRKAPSKKAAKKVAKKVPARKAAKPARKPAAKARKPARQGGRGRR